jgi:hypothetical protein
MQRSSNMRQSQFCTPIPSLTGSNLHAETQTRSPIEFRELAAMGRLTPYAVNPRHNQAGTSREQFASSLRSGTGLR